MEFITDILNKKEYIQLVKPIFFNMGHVNCVVLLEAYQLNHQLILPLYCKINKKYKYKQYALEPNHKRSFIHQDVFEFDCIEDYKQRDTVEYKTAYIGINIKENKATHGSWKSVYEIKDAPSDGVDLKESCEMNIECDFTKMKIHEISDLSEIKEYDPQLCYTYGLNYENELESLKLKAYCDYDSEYIENKFLEMMNIDQENTYILYDSKIHAEGFLKDYVKYSKRSLILFDANEEISDEPELKYYTGKYAFIPLRLDTSEKKIEIIESSYKSALFKLYKDDKTYVTYLGIEYTDNQDFIVAEFTYKYEKENYSLYVGCKLSKCKQTTVKHLDDINYL